MDDRRCQWCGKEAVARVELAPGSKRDAKAIRLPRTVLVCADHEASFRAQGAEAGRL